MIEITRKIIGKTNQKGTAKLGGIVCNKNAPVLKNAKLGSLDCNKNTSKVR